MKRLLIAAALTALSAAPASASAQDERHAAQDVRRDAPDLRQDQQRNGLPGLRYDKARPETWRGRAEWGGFTGPRDGFWYAPGYGYRPADRWSGHPWRRGEYLPAAYRGYYVQEPAFYGLRPPPIGCRWIYVGGNFVLAAADTGLISEVVLGGY